MNPKLLESQFATLEKPKDALCVVNDRRRGSCGEILRELAA
jgi:gluconate kinase